MDMQSSLDLPDINGSIGWRHVWNQNFLINTLPRYILTQPTRKDLSSPYTNYHKVRSLAYLAGNWRHALLLLLVRHKLLPRINTYILLSHHGPATWNYVRYHLVGMNYKSFRWQLWLARTFLRRLFESAMAGKKYRSICPIYNWASTWKTHSYVHFRDSRDVKDSPRIQLHRFPSNYTTVWLDFGHYLEANDTVKAKYT